MLHIPGVCGVVSPSPEAELSVSLPPYSCHLSPAVNEKGILDVKGREIYHS